MSMAGRYSPPARVARVPVLSISRCLTELARRDPDRPALVVGEQTVTRAELDRRTNALARSYAARGVQAGDHGDGRAAERRAFVEACLAAWKLGATPQPVSARLPAAELAASWSWPTRRWSSGRTGGRPLAASRRGGPHGRTTTASCPTRCPRSGRRPRPAARPAGPKLIVATVPGLFDPDVPAVPYLRTGEVQLGAGPLHHNGPFLYCFRGLLCGHTVVLMERFDAASALAARAAAPRAVRHGGADDDAAHLAPARPHVVRRLEPAHGAAPRRAVPAVAQARVARLAGPDRVLELYAGTEGNGITVITGREWLEHPGSVGRPGARLRGARAAPRDARGPAGRRGRRGVPHAGRRPGTTYRYVGATATSVDGWETPRRPRVPRRRRLPAPHRPQRRPRRHRRLQRLPGRGRGGARQPPAVRSSCVVGLPDDDLGERVHALVDAPGGVDVAELLAHVGERLVRYKVPRTVELVGAPLRDDAGKVRRSALRAERLTSR
jgi:bile acid-coenzyme A ligase